MVLMRAARNKRVKGNVSDEYEKMACDSNFHNHKGDFYAAVDIGTTTLSVQLFNHRGEYLDGCAVDNAQGQLGSDVMMRLMHASEGRAEKLHTLIRDQIYHCLLQLIHKNTQGDFRDSLDRENNRTDCCRSISEDTECRGNGMAHLKKISVVGNTAMCHLFLKKDTAGLRGAPFIPAYQGSIRLLGRELGWMDCPDVEIQVLPAIAAHVGADAAAVFQAERLWQKDRIQLALDLGTNAEIILNNRGVIWVCSTAAGPAFEGRGISCGCRGGAGAVNAVRVNRANGNIILDVIPDPSTGALYAKGFCGSGLVDLIAALLDAGLLQPDGYLRSQEEARNHGLCEGLVRRLQEKKGERRFLLLDPVEDAVTGAGRDDSREIYISQQDIRNFQLAKSAIQTGIALLCQQSGVRISQIEDCRVAGVFGAFLQINSAKNSGLLPDLPTDRISFVGNSAGKGAAQALFDAGLVKRLEKQVQEIRHIELAEQESFSSLFMQNMNLYPWNDTAVE